MEKTINFRAMDLQSVTRLDDKFYTEWKNYRGYWKKKTKAWSIDTVTIGLIENLAHPVYNQAGRSKSNIVNELLIRGLLALEAEINESTTDSE